MANWSHENALAIGYQVYLIACIQLLNTSLPKIAKVEIIIQL